MARKKKEKTEFNWSHYQQKIFEYIGGASGHLVVSAAAGSGKSSTLIKSLEYIPSDKKVLMSAFNRDIVSELKKKTKGIENVDVMTLHGLGLSMLKRNYPTKTFIPEPFKYESHIKNNIRFYTSINTYSLSGRNYFKYLDNIKKYVDFGRFYLCQTAKDLDFIEDRYGIDTIADEKQVAIKVMAWGKTELDSVDYTDMIWMPHVLFLKPIGLLYDFIMVDECLPYDTMVSTSNGNVKLGKLVSDFNKGKELPLVKSFNQISQKFEYKKIVNAWNKGEREILTIKCNGKKKIKCTKNHKILTINGYVRADEIKVGDFLLTDSTQQPFHPLLDKGDSKELFLASLVGDGSLDKISENVYRCKFIHGEDQKEYLEWKSKLFGECKIREVKNNGFSRKTAYAFNTKSFCIKDIEIDKSHIIENMTLKQLAINYCDNGYYDRTSGRMKIYSFVHNENLLQLFKEKIESFGINGVKIRTSKSNYNAKEYKFIEINAENSYKLLGLISKFMHHSLSYKVHDDFKEEIGTYEWRCSVNDSFGATIVSEIIDNNEIKEVFDIEVEDNHNFIISSRTNKYGVIVHNCQDMNKAERELVLKCFKMGTRLISVGDEKQMIYSFSGADPESFNALKSLPNTECLPLSISYRCPKNVVEFAQKLVPSIEYNEANPNQGFVKYDVPLSDVEDGDMILCRNNAPLVQVYNEFLKLGKKAFIRGKDIGANLKTLVKSIKQEKVNADCNEDGIFVRLYDDLFVTRNKIMERSAVDAKTAMTSPIIENKLDMIKALEILAEGTNTTDELIAKIDEIFPKRDKKDGIALSTIHKAKGLEANNVYIACKSLMPSKSAKKDWEIKQEHNLMYVAYTRAKNTLGFIDEKDFKDFDMTNNLSQAKLDRIEAQVNKVLGKTTKTIINENTAKVIVDNAKKIDWSTITPAKKTININSGRTVNSFADLFRNKKQVKVKR